MERALCADSSERWRSRRCSAKSSVCLGRTDRAARVAHLGDRLCADRSEITFADGAPEGLLFDAVTSQFFHCPDNLARGPVPPRDA